MSNVNRIDFYVPAGYDIRNHIMWSRNVGENGFGWIAVSGTADIPGVTIHGYEIKSRRDGRVALRASVRGQICQYGTWGLRGEKIFETADEAKYFAAWHSESIIFDSLN